jgi:hypothetical protein
MHGKGALQNWASCQKRVHNCLSATAAFKEEVTPRAGISRGVVGFIFSGSAAVYTD